MRGPALRVLAILTLIAAIQCCVAATSRKEGKLSCLLPICGLPQASHVSFLLAASDLTKVVGHHA